MGGRTSEQSRRLDLAAIARRNEGVPVRFIDDVAMPVDDGRYVTLMITADGLPVEVLVLTTENFYDCLGKLMATSLPSMGRVRSH
jgi:hypothetical protein